MEKSPIVKIAKKICPAVITIITTKELPRVNGFYLTPFGGQNFIIPKIEAGKKKKTKIGGGSGFIVSEDGYILTSQHVVEDIEADYTIILEPNENYSAKVLARNPINDIAILKLGSPFPNKKLKTKRRKRFPYLKLGNSNKVELGQTVIAVGNALGEFNDTLSAGIISGLSRYISAAGGLSPYVESLRGLIQTDAAINPGNSGGPLVDLDGKVIGINTAMVAGAQNIGFAIPINYAKKNLAEIKKYGKIKRPFLGIKYIILNEEISAKNSLPVNYGALIVRERLGTKPIFKGSAAEKAGLKEFDIILKCNGEKVTGKNSLGNILQKFEVGQKVSLKILREGKIKTVKAKLEERK